MGELEQVMRLLVGKGIAIRIDFVPILLIQLPLTFTILLLIRPLAARNLRRGIARSKLILPSILSS